MIYLGLFFIGHQSHACHSQKRFHFIKNIPNYQIQSRVFILKMFNSRKSQSKICTRFHDADNVPQSKKMFHSKKCFIPQNPENHHRKYARVFTPPTTNYYNPKINPIQKTCLINIIHKCARVCGTLIMYNHTPKYSNIFLSNT